MYMDFVLKIKLILSNINILTEKQMYLNMKRNLIELQLIGVLLLYNPAELIIIANKKVR